MCIFLKIIYVPYNLVKKTMSLSMHTYIYKQMQLEKIFSTSLVLEE